MGYSQYQLVTTPKLGGDESQGDVHPMSRNQSLQRYPSFTVDVLFHEKKAIIQTKCVIDLRVAGAILHESLHPLDIFGLSPFCCQKWMEPFPY